MDFKSENQKKTKYMIFNFSKKYQFSTRLLLNDKNIEEIDSTKLLGTFITKDLKWDLNTSNIVKKATMRLQLLIKVASFGASIEDLKTVYITFVRSILEQSAVVWHSSLTEENKQDLERIQRSAVLIMMGQKFKSYSKSLLFLDLEDLNSRRENLCLTFALRTMKN